MQRREFITVLGGAAVAWPLSLHAQQGARERRIGILMGYAESDPETKLRIAAFRSGLAKRGGAEGHNIQNDYRFSAATDSQQTACERIARASSRGRPRAYDNGRRCRATGESRNPGRVRWGL